MNFDRKVGKEREQFASQVSRIDESALQVIKTGFAGDQNTDFYEGLLSGFASSYRIIENLPTENPVELIGSLIAYVSEILEERM